MTTHYKFGFGWGTAAEIAAYDGLIYEPVYDTTNLRLVIMLGTGAGNKVALASESYVQSQVGAVAAGAGQIFTLWNNCT